MSELAMSMFVSAEEYWKARSYLNEQVVADMAKELGCERDNEEMLMKLHELQEGAALGRADGGEEMKRYDITMAQTGEHEVDAISYEHPDGPYVKHADVEAELARLRAVNAELVEALKSLLSACERGQKIQRGGIGGQAVEAKPETCMWTPTGMAFMGYPEYRASCGFSRVTSHPSRFKTCPGCGLRIEVKE